MRYDLVVLGGGPAGEKAAAAAAYFGKSVALVDASPDGLGGATVHTGTLPSKTLRETALFITGFKRRQLYAGLRWDVDGRQRTAAELTHRLPEVRATQTRQIHGNVERHGIELVRGRGRLEDANHVRVSGDRVLEADYLLIATGSAPRRPAGFDFSDPDVFDSDSLLAIDRIPSKLAVIGGGVIGSEYACVFAALGVSVELIEGGPRVLGFLDHDVSDALMGSMRAAGIELHLNDGVEALERKDGKLVLSLKSGKARVVDKALVCAGRVGNTSDLGLDRLGVKLDGRGLIVVDADFRTSVPNVFAAGDVLGRPALASTSMEQGRMAVAAMFGLSVPRRDWAAIPAGIYTIPEASSVGPTEQELVDAGVPHVVGRSDMRHNARGQIIGDTDGFVKLIFHRETRKLLATHVVAEQATELVHIGQAVMRLGGGIDYFLETVLTYPSLTTAYKFAAYDALGKLSATGAPKPPTIALALDDTRRE
ncbi:Si-specific NAD(P)(+) transhydrogenase [Myxococcota bacterium]|nr:Si-specific NAD(P)(+) transhydrogenase [Myxococcota bacterium]